MVELVQSLKRSIVQPLRFGSYFVLLLCARGLTHCQSRIVGALGKQLFLFSRVLRDSTTRFVGPSVRPSVGPLVRRSHFTFLGVLRCLASLLLPK